jgi:hypothetical protein
MSHIKLKDLLLEVGKPKFSKHQRIHVNDEPRFWVDMWKYYYKKAKNQRLGTKPNGLWYAFGNEWLDFIEANDMQWKSKSNAVYYEVEPPTGHVLTIKSEKQMDIFVGAYGERTTLGAILIDWPKVKKDWKAGVEINIRDSVDVNDPKFGWYYGWDVACGCAWGNWMDWTVSPPIQ